MVLLNDHSFVSSDGGCLKCFVRDGKESRIGAFCKSANLNKHVFVKQVHLGGQLFRSSKYQISKFDRVLETGLILSTTTNS